jgi:hypothetical protein
MATKEPASKWEAPEDWQDAEGFEIGKAYQFRGTGELMHVIGSVDTLGYGATFIAETHGGFNPIGMGSGHSDNWREVPLSQWYAEWLPANAENGDMRERYEAALEEESKARALEVR